jgi:hypothetical protein
MFVAEADGWCCMYCPEFQKPLVSGLSEIEKTDHFLKAQNTNFIDENRLTDRFDRLTVLFLFIIQILNVK